MNNENCEPLFDIDQIVKSRSTGKYYKVIDIIVTMRYHNLDLVVYACTEVGSPNTFKILFESDLKFV